MAGFAAGRYTAIDLGTVTCRMLLADVDAAGRLREVRREYRIINLGEGVDAAGRLSQAAIKRAAATIGGYRAIAEAEGAPVRLVAFATSAARDAANADELVRQVAEAGVALRVIPGEEEARLSFSGASMDFSGQDLLVVDVGGGSTEVVAGHGGASVARSRSFDVGCRRMTERFLRSDPPAADERRRAAAWAREQMAPYFDELRAAGLGWERVVAVAGTATTAVSLIERMRDYDPARVHGYRVSRAALAEQLERLAALPLAARRDVAGLDPDRAPVIVAGLQILLGVLDLAGADAFTASETDILQGAVLAAAGGRWG